MEFNRMSFLSSDLWPNSVLLRVSVVNGLWVDVIVMVVFLTGLTGWFGFGFEHFVHSVHSV